jgi:hypothetical protein
MTNSRCARHKEFDLRRLHGSRLRALQNWRGARRVLRRTPLNSISRPVSRVLYGLRLRNRRRDGHSSGTPVARRVKQPTRTAGPDRPGACPRASGETLPRRSYSVLLPVGFAVPLPLPASAVRSYRTVSPLPRPKRYAAAAVCSLWHCP